MNIQVLSDQHLLNNYRSGDQSAISKLIERHKRRVRDYIYTNLFYGFKYLFKKSLGISAVLILLNTACTLPFDICYFLLRSGKGFDAITMAILCIVLMVIGMCIYIPLSLGLSQAYYLLLDFPQYSAMELMKLSFRIMKGHVPVR